MKPAMFSGTLIWLRSASPFRPPRGGARQKFVSPKTKVRPISRWTSKNLSRAKVSASLPDQAPESGAWNLKRWGKAVPRLTPPGPSSLILAVAVVVEALGIELPDALLALGPVGLLHQARLAGDGDPGALGVLDPHLGDEAVAVEVVGAVLVGLVVLVVVAGPGVAGVEAQGLAEVDRGGVRVAAGQDVPGPVGPQVGFLADELGQVEGRLAGDGHRPFHVGRDEDGGKVLRRLRRLGADLEQDELAAAGALGQDVDLGEAGVGPGQVLERRGQFLGPMVAVEGQVGRGQGAQGET